jgi:thiaminase
MKSAALEKEFRKYLDQIGESLLHFPWEDQDAYASWLAQTYFFVRHTTSMICLSAAKFGPQNRQEHMHAIHHLAEERGHDQLLLNDLKHLGYEIKDFSEEPVTQLFYQNQYYMIEKEGPASHLGYALLLEAAAAQFGPALHDKICRRHGQPAGTFLEVHTKADQDHAKEGLDALLSMEPHHAQSAMKNLRQSALLYEIILGKSAAANSRKKAS